MKKVILLLIAAALFPVAASAQSKYNVYAYSGREGKAMLFADVISGRIKAAAVKAAKANQEAQSAKASASLKALQGAYNEHAKLISDIASTHDFIVNELKKENNDLNNLYETMTFQLEYLYEDVAALQKVSPEAVAQVSVILDHEYFMVPSGEFLTLRKLSNEVLRAFPHLTLKGYTWYQSLS